ncbi:hypothetical protein OEZ85_005095 [Tetradesmus obliquus]|uniref:Uncharacterized protein n=1 Tax=Tetradesmus obliquus TaxID=3088 RepID=A0ABY8UH99_TETOB|nr:hypothetical protein OEZ85_005095 [Tetradesmus obliquus]
MQASSAARAAHSPATHSKAQVAGCQVTVGDTPHPGVLGNTATDNLDDSQVTHLWTTERLLRDTKLATTRTHQALSKITCQVTHE